MSVVVKGMQMPTRCLNCPMYDDYNFLCKLYSFRIPARYNYVGSTRPEWCPLVDLGKHGKLIDADALEPDADYDDGEYWAYSVAQVCSAKPVIEAERTDK